MCHSMQELPCVESFVIDETVRVIGSIQDLILRGQLSFARLSNWMSGHYVALRLRASLCIDLSNLGNMC